MAAIVFWPSKTVLSKPLHPFVQKKQFLLTFCEHIFVLKGRTMTNPTSPAFVICCHWWCLCLIRTLPCQKDSAPVEWPSGHSPATDLLWARRSVCHHGCLHFHSPETRHIDITVLGQAANNQQLTLLAALELVQHEIYTLFGKIHQSTTFLSLSASCWWFTRSFLGFAFKYFLFFWCIKLKMLPTYISKSIAPDFRRFSLFMMQIDVEVSVYSLQEIQPAWGVPAKHWEVP